MKKIGILLILVMFVLPVRAEQIIITVTAEQVKAVEGIVLDAQEWLQAAWNGKANKCIERIIIQETNLNPNKLTKQEKEDKIKALIFKTRKQKDIERNQ